MSERLNKLGYPDMRNYAVPFRFPKKSPKDGKPIFPDALKCERSLFGGKIESYQMVWMKCRGTKSGAKHGTPSHVLKVGTYDRFQKSKGSGTAGKAHNIKRKNPGKPFPRNIAVTMETQTREKVYAEWKRVLNKLCWQVPPQSGTVIILNHLEKRLVIEFKVSQNFLDAKRVEIKKCALGRKVVTK